MTLREALLYAKEHGGYVVYKSWHNGSETCQHFWDKDGALNWDYFGSCGEKMPEGLEDKRICGSLEMEGFNVFESHEDRPYTEMSKAVSEAAEDYTSKSASKDSIRVFMSFLAGANFVRDNQDKYKDIQV